MYLKEVIEKFIENLNKTGSPVVRVNMYEIRDTGDKYFELGDCPAIKFPSTLDEIEEASLTIDFIDSRYDLVSNDIIIFSLYDKYAVRVYAHYVTVSDIIIAFILMKEYIVAVDTLNRLYFTNDYFDVIGKENLLGLAVDYSTIDIVNELLNVDMKPYVDEYIASAKKVNLKLLGNRLETSKEIIRNIYKRADNSHFKPGYCSEVELKALLLDYARRHYFSIGNTEEIGL